MLIGTKVCLGPMFQADAPIVFNWRNSMDLMHLDGLYRPVSQGSFDEWFGSIGKDPARVVFSIRRQGDLQFLGFVQIINLHPVFHSAEIGIMIGAAEHRGQGYGQEALRLCVQFCWQELNLQRLSMLVVGENAPALRSYGKAGFEREGVLRRCYYLDGEFRDVTVMGLLR
jgi:RimJ/RimL family protein N-acetyltransferase